MKEVVAVILVVVVVDVAVVCCSCLWWCHHCHFTSNKNHIIVVIQMPCYSLLCRGEPLITNQNTEHLLKGNGVIMVIRHPWSPCQSFSLHRRPRFLV
jgi:hypothetical protein